MRSEIFFSSLIIFLTITLTQAQPSSPPIFNPFYMCQYATDEVDHIFYGEIASIEEFDAMNGVKIDYFSKNVRFKAVVKVARSFKSNQPGEVVVYFGDEFQLNKPLKKNSYLFRTKDALKDGIQTQYVKQLSKAMTDYSKKAKQEVFENVKSFVNNEKTDFVEGILLDRLFQVREVNLKGEQANRLIYEVKLNSPVPNTLIEFVNKKSGVNYWVKTKSNGAFRLNRLPDGIYDVRIQSPGKRVENSLTFFDRMVCSNKRFFYVIPVSDK